MGGPAAQRRTPHLSHDTGVQDASATCWPACRAPCARAVSCEAENGASGARSSSTARAARRGRPCPTSSGRSCHSSCGGRASWYPTVARRPTTHRTRRPWAAARGRGAGSAAGSRRAAPASLVRYCAIALMSHDAHSRIRPHPTQGWGTSSPRRLAPDALAAATADATLLLFRSFLRRSPGR